MTTVNQTAGARSPSFDGMTVTESVDVWCYVRELLGALPGESINDAALRVHGAGASRRWLVAQAVLEQPEARGAAAWAKLRRAAELGRSLPSRAGVTP